MGFYGEVICYTVEARDDPMRLVDALMRRLGVSSAERLFIYSEPDESWKRWLLEKSGVECEEEAFEIVDGPVPADRLRTLFPRDGRMHLFFGTSPVAMPVCVACANLPEELTNRFSPSASPAICIGWHDIIDGEYSEPFLVDRAFLSVSLSNPGAPNHWDETRRRILELPELHAFRAAIEEFAGPMKSCVRWT